MYRGTHITGRYIYYCHNASSLLLQCFAAEPKGDTHNTAAILERGTRITSDMCIPTGKRISQVTCTGLHISHTFPTHILHTYDCDNASSLRSLLPRPRGCITRQPYWKGVHISLVICVSPPGIRISQVICVQGYTHYTYITHCGNASSVRTSLQRPKGDTHNTAAILEGGTHITSDMCTGIHISQGYIYYCHNASSLRNSLQSSRGIHITWQTY